MRRATLALAGSLTLLLLSGCGSDPIAPSGPRADLFAAREAKLHPVFTRISDWTGDGKPDGIDALVELRDSFGDTTKGAGTFTFELYDYRRDQPDPRGRRVGDVWRVDVVTADQQRARYSKTSRCYSFRLQSPEAGRGVHVMTVAFSPVGGGPRLFDQIVIEARANGEVTTQPRD